MKEELCGKMTEFPAFWAKTYSNLIDDGDENNEVKGTKKCHKKKIQIQRWKKLSRSKSTRKWNKLSRKNKLDLDNLREKHKKIIENIKIVLRSQQRFWTQNHNVFIEEVHKIAFSTYDDKRI